MEVKTVGKCVSSLRLLCLQKLPSDVPAYLGTALTAVTFLVEWQQHSQREIDGVIHTHHYPQPSEHIHWWSTISQPRYPGANVPCALFPPLGISRTLETPGRAMMRLIRQAKNLVSFQEDFLQVSNSFMNWIFLYQIIVHKFIQKFHKPRTNKITLKKKKIKGFVLWGFKTYYEAK